ncbi:membrane-bound O-acyltransferase family protein Ecym_2227 [Eremothecium cymbalariae DBVPG|uniref:Glycerol uptake protein 1 n=1 Tax=Eremothecium cymbalariae (strain CBS 270.75 / DBVPG 7215 / KCTC 17166 / NRRL Y-17582) TaxID=931890 RepID=G8JP70_ERECY|nr:Hypothetical protein Ecym_2227 [Eremothecium cymbalariae DBVPG\
MLTGNMEAPTKNWISLLFSLESLDARLAPPKDVKRRQQISLNAGKSRWNTLEFWLYYLVFIIVIPLMFKTGMDASNELNPNYPKYERLLSDGWLFGRKVDNSDDQYRFFRDNFLLLLGLMLGHTSIKKCVIHFSSIKPVTFDFGFGLVFISAAHGVNALRVLVHLFAMFSIVKMFKKQRRLATILSWTYGIGTLFFNNSYKSYPFGSILSILSFLDTSYKGLIGRWDVFFNFTLLRMLSFNMDYLERWHNVNQKERLTTPTLYENDDTSASTKNHELVSLAPIRENAFSEEILDERSRLVAPHSLRDYSIKNYLAYVTYTPLFIAGPIITFNDYLYQSCHTLPSIAGHRIVRYALNLTCCLLTMEFLLHFMYVVAVSKTKAWAGDTPFQLSMIGLFNLNVIWLKLLIPWRLFRLWAMLDGIDPPENMIRSVDNNYSALAFWRAWHRSYNKWVVRYIYIPLGGSSNRLLTSLAVFSFVAIWHDIEMRLLLWGWLIVLFLFPEILATKYFGKYSKESWYRSLCGVGCVFNLWLMMIANLFGFCLGSSGTMQLLKDIFSTQDGIVFFFCANTAIYVAVQVMFEQREHEKRQGINVKC